eukprot:NODE_4219_length_356_cov_394.478827_g3627_i0.p1 GENE.NODE_4219_length_356_cov_394.478827_g3627_i0~~NODE_4219_length_356_cov_394.478827_g3627_i0.p1  ORF type:complete len:89 (+),score=21.66 NODE_4219_length_356_cov_394.478827_g3627_i0:30-269(+)
MGAEVHRVWYTEKCERDSSVRQAREQARREGKSDPTRLRPTYNHMTPNDGKRDWRSSGGGYVPITPAAQRQTMQACAVM